MDEGEKKLTEIGYDPWDSDSEETPNDFIAWGVF